MALDPNVFMNQTTEAAGDVSAPVPDPGEYPAQVVDVEGRAITLKSGDRAGQEAALIDVRWELDAPEFESEYGYKPRCRQSIWLDTMGDGSLDFGKGKNVSLNRLREALGQNEPGQAWAPSMMKGQPAKVLINHRMDGDRVYTDVSSVRSIHEA